MARRPLGPWTSMETNTYSLPIIYKYAGWASSSSIQQGKTYGSSVARYGFNAGKYGDHSKPYSASLTGNTMKPQLCMVNWYNSGSSYCCKGNGYYITNLGYNTPETNIASDTSASNKALARFHSRLGSMIDAGVSIGELKETTEMVKHYSNRLLGFHNKQIGKIIKTKYFKGTYPSRVTIKQFKSQDAKQFVQELSGHYLAYNFGVKPLINDVSSAAQALSNVLNKFDEPKLIGVASFNGGNTYDYGVSEIPMERNVGFTHRVVCDSIWKGVYKYGATYRSDLYGSRSSALKNLGLNENRILPTIYELVPYSWLVDYFTNFGDILEAWSAPYYTIKDGWTVKFSVYAKTYRSTSVVTGGVRSGFSITGYQPLVITKTTRHFTRDPVPVASFKPTFELRFPDIAQSANVAAVALQRILGRSIATDPETVHMLNSLIKKG